MTHGVCAISHPGIPLHNCFIEGLLYWHNRHNRLLSDSPAQATVQVSLTPVEEAAMLGEHYRLPAGTVLHGQQHQR
jgi:hypothetical protein